MIETLGILGFAKDALEGLCILGKKTFKVCDNFADKIVSKIENGQKCPTVSLETIDLTEIESWFAKFKDERNLIGVVLVVSDAMKKALKIEESTQDKKMLFQAILDENHEKFIEQRLLCYSYIELQFQKLLDDRQGCLVVEF